MCTIEAPPTTNARDDIRLVLLHLQTLVLSTYSEIQFRVEIEHMEGVWVSEELYFQAARKYRFFSCITTPYLHNSIVVQLMALQ